MVMIKIDCSCNFLLYNKFIELPCILSTTIWTLWLQMIIKPWSLSLQANEAVCLVEVDGAPVLSPPAGMDMDMYGTEKLGVLGKIRSWKAVSPN